MVEGESKAPGSSTYAATRGARGPEKVAADMIGESPDQSSVVGADSSQAALPNDPDQMLAELVATLLAKGDRATALAMLAAYDNAQRKTTADEVTNVVLLAARRRP
jgi:hypothetical protein